MPRAAAVILALVVLVGCSQPSRPRSDHGPGDRVTDGDRATPATIHDAASGDAASPASGDASPPAKAAALAIVDAPIAWTEERSRLTLAYRRAHSDAAATDLEIEPRVIVLHHTGGGSATATRNYFNNVRMEGGRAKLARAGAVNVSAHFVVDRDGTIYRLVPENRFARHCIGLNHLAIGVENVGDLERWPLTDAQVAANAALVRELARRFPITHLLGHHEVMAFRDHAYYVELDPAYRNSKPDPGAAFMARVRAEVADLNLASK